MYVFIYRQIFFWLTPPFCVLSSLDPRATLLPMHRQLAVSGLDAGLHDKILAALATRYDRRPKTVKLYMLPDVDSWGRVRISEGGDTLHTSHEDRCSKDGHDSSYVRVSTGETSQMLSSTDRLAYLVQATRRYTCSKPRTRTRVPPRNILWPARVSTRREDVPDSLP
jgi:hypothetical protein